MVRFKLRKPLRSRSSRMRKGYKRIPRSMLSMKRPKTQNSIYSFSRYASQKQTIYLTSTEVDNAWYYQFNQISNFNDFTQLFDQYKITGIKQYFRLVTNPDAPSATMTNTFVYPSLWLCPDRDDGAAITLQQIKEKQGVKRIVMLPNRIVSRYVKVNIAPLVYEGVTTSGYSVAQPRWIDMNSPAVQHYGLKSVIENCGVSGLGQYQIEVETKYYFSCKGAQ